MMNEAAPGTFSSEYNQFADSAKFLHYLVKSVVGLSHRCFSG